MSLTESVKAEARRLGFQLVGVATPEPPPHFSVFENWLDAGRHGAMGYLAADRARQRRADPRLILPECRSILVLGMRYPVPVPNLEAGTEPAVRGKGEEGIGGSAEAGPPAGNRLRGRVAAYAWGDDYHTVFQERLQKLMVFMEEQAGGAVPHRWYADTGPVLERDLAQRAGLGWIGKNSCLINPEQGSYFLLAEILLGIELDLDPAFLPDRCGACTRCLEACPTSCILPDRTLDARRCLSYLTIELKGPLPAGLRPQLGEWVFGCDICQEVCPWNQRFAGPESDPAFLPRPGVVHPDLVEELSLTPEGFNRKFKNSPVKRAKRRGYLRNVAVALGNQAAGREDPAVSQALSQALLGDPEPLVRGHAAWALGRIGGAAAGQALSNAAEQETDLYVLAEIREALEAERQIESRPG